jgi:hypothetical protein
MQVVMFTSIRNLVLKQMQYNVYFGRKCSIKNNASSSDQIINYIYYVNIKNIFNKLWVKFHPERKAYFLVKYQAKIAWLNYTVHNLKFTLRSLCHETQE